LVETIELRSLSYWTWVSAGTGLKGRSTPYALQGELLHTDPTGRNVGMRQPARRATKRRVVHDSG
jgi:hypothetical protein